ncbi:MAG: hypothetical protein ACRDX8_11410 [Acidimicrobiales bacterium]
MAKVDLAYGDEVIVPWSNIHEVRATVHEVYGPPSREHVLVILTPELSGFVVDEPTTLSVPADLVRKGAPAA